MSFFKVVLFFLILLITLFSDSIVAQTNSVLVGLQKKIAFYEAENKIHPNDFKNNCQLIEAYIANANYNKAKTIINQEIRSKRRNLKEKMVFGLYLAEIKKFQNDTSGALYNYLKCKKYFQSVKDQKLILKANSYLIEFYRKKVKYKEANDLIQEVETKRVPLHLKKSPESILFYNRAAAVFNETNQPEKSIQYSNKAIALAEIMNDTNSLCISYNELGFSYKNSHRQKKALYYYQKAQKLWEEKGYYRESLNAELNCIRVIIHNGWISLDDQIPLLRAFERKCSAYGFAEINYLNQILIQSNYEQRFLWKEAYVEQKKTWDLANKLNEIVNTREITKVVEQFKNNDLKQEIKKKNKARIVLLEQKEKDKQTIWLFSLLVILAIVFLCVSVVFAFRFRKSLQKIRLKEEQKSMLISEIHHRVKNNLQYVKSILEMQMSIISESGDKGNLEDVSRRIQAMTLVHEMLYTETDQVGVWIKKYLSELIRNLNLGFSSQTELDIELDIWDGEMSISEATSIGIICAELFNNSIKHAFVKNSNPKFLLHLEKQLDEFQLTVSDNGTEQTDKKDELESDRHKLGLRIIDIFARQLKGKYEINTTNGYSFDLKFKATTI